MKYFQNFLELILLLQISTSFQVNITILDPFLEEDEDLGSDYSSVVSLKYHLVEETLPELFSEIALNNIGCNFKDCNVSFINIVEATQLSKFSTDDLVESIKWLNITSADVYNIPLIYNISSNDIQTTMAKLQVSCSETYKKFQETLTNPSETVPIVLNMVNVSIENFMKAIAFGNDNTCIEALYTGNYSEENVEAVLNLINKTGYDILNLLPINNILLNLPNIEEKSLTLFIKNLGISGEKLNDFYKYLNITSIHFLSYPPFITILMDYKEYLNSEDNVGVIISPSEVITVSKTKSLKIYLNQTTKLVKKYSGFHAELVENPLVQYDVKKVILNSPNYSTNELAVVELQSMTLTYKNISIIRGTNLRNCTYISKIPFGLRDNIIPLAQIYNNTIIFPKTNLTTFTLGCPLFCQDELVGMATEELPGHIKLSVLKLALDSTSTLTSTTSTANNTTTTQGSVSQVPTNNSSTNVTDTEFSESNKIAYSMFSISLLLTLQFYMYII